MADDHAHAPGCTPNNPCSGGLCDGTVERFIRNEGEPQMTTTRITTTTEIERGEDGKWVPVERTSRIETHETTSVVAEHVVSDTEGCWCNPTVISVPGVDETEPPDSYWVGSQPPFSVTHIDPETCGTKTDQWFVMGTVDGDPRNQQGPVAICEYQPSAHAIAALLNATVAAGDHQAHLPSRGVTS